MSRRGVRLGLLALLAAVIVVLRADEGWQQAKAARADTITAPAVVQAPSGYLANGMAMLHGRQQCLLLRVVSADCHFCRTGAQGWDALAGGLRRYGCRALGIAETAGAALPSAEYGFAAEDQLTLVTMDWVKEFHPRLTPTTMVLGLGGRVIWYHPGALRSGDLRGAVAALRAHGMGGGSGTRK